MDDSCDAVKGIFCGKINNNVPNLKKIIREKRQILDKSSNSLIRRNTSALFKDGQMLKHIFLSVKNSHYSRKILLDLLDKENRANIEAIYQLYGDYDFCIELQGSKRDLDQIESNISALLEKHDQLTEGDLQNPLIRNFTDFIKLHGIEKSDVDREKGVYFINYEEANAIGIFVHVELGKKGNKFADKLYEQIKKRIVEDGKLGEDRESFLFSASYSKESSVLWFMLLAECHEYYRLNMVSDILDDVFEDERFKKTTYPIAGLIHNDVNNEGFRDAFTRSGNGTNSRPNLDAAQATHRDNSSKIFDIFLAHNSSDKAEVDDIYRQFEAAGLACWFDKAQMKAGDLSWEKILDGINKSKFIAVCVGKSGLGDWQSSVEFNEVVDRVVHRKCKASIILLTSFTDRQKAECEGLLRPLIHYTWSDFRLEGEFNKFVQDRLNDKPSAKQ